MWTWKILDVMAPIANAHGCSAARLSLAWLLAKPVLTSVIIGAKCLDQLQDDLAAVELILTQEGHSGSWMRSAPLPLSIQSGYCCSRESTVWNRLIVWRVFARRTSRVEEVAELVAIREASEHDRDAVWEIFRTVVAAGDTYVFDPAISREEALAYWFHPGTRTYVAESEGRVVGTYILRPNQPGLGSHVSNAAFMVSPSARGLGIGRTMGEHCLEEARRSAIGPCSSTSWSRRTNLRSSCGSDSALPSSAPSLVPSAMGPAVSLMPTSCSRHSVEPHPRGRGGLRPSQPPSEMNTAMGQVGHACMASAETSRNSFSVAPLAD